jgi:hypothetical protein
VIPLERETVKGLAMEMETGLGRVIRSARVMDFRLVSAKAMDLDWEMVTDSRLVTVMDWETATEMVIPRLPEMGKATGSGFQKAMALAMGLVMEKEMVKDLVMGFRSGLVTVMDFLPVKDSGSAKVKDLGLAIQMAMVTDFRSVTEREKEMGWEMVILSVMEMGWDWVMAIRLVMVRATVMDWVMDLHLVMGLEKAIL